MRKLAFLKYPCSAVDWVLDLAFSVFKEVEQNIHLWDI
jgi:hypothetical protein